MILLDTSGLLAALVGNQRSHEAAKAALERTGGPFVLSPFVLAELDHVLVSFLDDAMASATGVIERYRHLGVGLADASIVVLARRLGTERVLTPDERRFRAMTTPLGGAFVLPADAPTIN